MNKRQKWFHVAHRDFGSVLELKPSVPTGTIRGENKTVPRVSVAPSLRHCLAALTGIPHMTPVLYEYVGKERPRKARRFVPDAFYSEEHWLVKPAKFKRIAPVVVHGSLGLASVGSRKELKQLIKRVLTAPVTTEQNGAIHVWDEQTYPLRKLLLSSISKERPK